MGQAGLLTGRCSRIAFLYVLLVPSFYLSFYRHRDFFFSTSYLMAEFAGGPDFSTTYLICGYGFYPILAGCMAALLTDKYNTAYAVRGASGFPMPWHLGLGAGARTTAARVSVRYGDGVRQRRWFSKMPSSPKCTGWADRAVRAVTMFMVLRTSPGAVAVRTPAGLAELPSPSWPVAATHRRGPRSCCTTTRITGSRAEYIAIQYPMGCCRTRGRRFIPDLFREPDLFQPVRS